MTNDEAHLCFVIGHFRHSDFRPRFRHSGFNRLTFVTRAGPRLLRGAGGGLYERSRDHDARDRRTA
jgi:hypothetical protein